MFIVLTFIETNIAILRLIEIFYEILPSVALMITLPNVAKAVITPDELMLAFAKSLDFHVTAFVSIYYELSLYFPVALRLCVLPLGIVVTYASIIICVTVAGTNYIIEVPDTFPFVAVIVTVLAFEIAFT